jgi:hypothetical protein
MNVLQFLIAFALWCVIALALVWHFKKASDPPVHDPRIIRAVDVPALAIAEPVAD